MPNPGLWFLRRLIHLPVILVALFSAAFALGSCARQHPMAALDNPVVLAPVSKDEKRLMAARDTTRDGAHKQDKSFRPRVATLIDRRPAGEPQHLSLPPRKERVQESLASLPPAQPPLIVDVGKPLARFRAKLAALDAGTRTEPVVVVHIGDSHIAADSFTRGIRKRFQARFGDAGRGQVIPADAFKYAVAQSVHLASSGPWHASMSLKTGDGVFGLSGVRVESRSPSARMVLKADEDFDWAEVTAATGPRQGSFEVLVDDRPAGRFSAKAAATGAKTFHVAVGGRTLAVRPVGDGETGVLYWATGRNEPGVRYINFGQSGATVNVTKRWDPDALASNLKSIRPDLIVYGFGTNEGFNDNVGVSAYRDYVAGFLKTVRKDAPDADLMIIGASDGLRRHGGRSCGNGWYVPPKLGALRDTMHNLADQIGAGFWDWSADMGGPCSMDRWAHEGLGRSDHVHFTPKGYDKSAAAFYAALVGPLDRPMVVANKR